MYIYKINLKYKLILDKCLFNYEKQLVKALFRNYVSEYKSIISTLTSTSLESLDHSRRAPKN